MSTSTPTYDQSRPPLWRDIRVLRVVGQAVFSVLVVALLWFLYSNLTSNLAARNLPTGFDFLRQPGSFSVRDTFVQSSTPIWQVILVGVKNTILVSAVGILLATVIGVLLGVARLSTNWLVRKGAALYVETVRNIPVLVWIIFFASAVILRLPPVTEPLESPGNYIVSNQGIWVPSTVTPEGNAGRLLWVAVLGLLLAGAVAWWRTRYNERTGTPHHRVLWALGTFVVVAVVGYLLVDVPIELTRPARDGFRVEGGFKFDAAYTGVLLGLVVYTASHIAEIVRGSILAVPKGQSEAANAVALTGFQRMRYVVLPQATRIMVPPTANQYLNLTKNSSLALAVGYADITSVVGTIIGNGRPAPQNIAILMAVYLALSLVISLFANIYNRRIQYVTQ